MDKNNSQILSGIKTVKEKYELINLIEEIGENIFKRDPKDYSDHSPFVASMSKFIYGEINKRGLKSNRKATEKYLEELIKMVKALPEMKITLAIEPTEDLIVKIKDWINKNVGREIVIDITVKSEIMGGLIVVSPNGQYINYSLSEQIDKLFTNKRQEISTLL